MYTEVARCNVVEAIADAVKKLSVEAKDEVVQCQLVEVSGNPKDANKITLELQLDEKAKAAYPTVEEDLIDYLNRCRLKNSEVMLCPRCSSIFDKEATKRLERVVLESKKRGKWYVFKKTTFPFSKS